MKGKNAGKWLNIMSNLHDGPSSVIWHPFSSLVIALCERLCSFSCRGKNKIGVIRQEITLEIGNWKQNAIRTTGLFGEEMT